MKTYKVLKNFQDSQNNLSLHKVGEDVTLSDKRGNELAERGFIALKDDDVIEKLKAQGFVESEEINEADFKESAPKTAPKTPKVKTAKTVSVTKEEKEFGAEQ